MIGFIIFAALLSIPTIIDVHHAGIAGEAADLVSSKEFCALKEKAEKTKADLEAMTEKFNAMEKRLEGTIPPTPTEVENAGGADDTEQEYI